MVEKITKLLQEDTSDKLSKGNIMCWISFVAIIIIVFLQLLNVNVANVAEANETLKYIFTTTFVYSAYKKGKDAFKEIQINKNGFTTKKD